MKITPALLAGTLIVVIAIAVGAFFLSPAPIEPTILTTPGNGSQGTDLSIVESTQGQYGDLRIGVGYVRQERTPVAGLWLYLRTDASQDKTVAVHEGEVVSIGSYKITVTKIETGIKGVARLHIEKITTP